MHILAQPAPPIPPPLRGADPASFARDTIVRRLPAIARRVLAENDLAPTAAAAIAALADELPSGAMRPLNDPGTPDTALWDSYVAPFLGQSWLDVPWFFAETYFYRRILEATGFFGAGPGALSDPFALQKRRGLAEAPQVQGAPLTLADALAASLWGNQADLSLWPAGEGGGPAGAHLLADDTEAALVLLARLAERSAPVALVLDNAGAELVHDLLLVDTLLTHGLPVVLHLKPHPTFVSDATVADLDATLAWLSVGPPESDALAERLRAARERGLLTLRSDWYWTSPLVGWELPEALARELAQCGLLISKGDANYRRWLGDRHWPPDAPLSRVLAYAPAPLLLLRTSKSEVAAGLDPTRLAAAAALDAQWRTSGRWGLIQLSAG